MGRTIPVVDLSKFRNGNAQDRAEFVQELGNAFQDIGFVGVKNHGIPKTLVDGFYSSAKSFFGLPVENKRKYEVPGLAG